MNILEEIVAYKKAEVAAAKKLQTIEVFKQGRYYSKPCTSLKTKLVESEDPCIIAEFKRRSPSKNQIAHSDINIADVITNYYHAEATANSILTDEQYFGGSIADFVLARSITPLPLLRKEFIIDSFQIYESKSIGADVILLIAAILDKETIESFTDIAHDIGLEVLCEIHDINELDKLNDNIDIIGINNRNLKTFDVDYRHSVRLKESLPTSMATISESGISNPQTVVDLHKEGFDGFLIGEAFMKERHPGEALAEFRNQIKSKL